MPPYRWVVSRQVSVLQFSFTPQTFDIYGRYECRAKVSGIISELEEEDKEE